MELILSAISVGGLVGAANQYACLLIVAIAARLGWVELSPPVAFMSGYWFIGILAVFFLLNIAPAYASLLSPGVMNVIDSITNFLGGFIVPLSGALLSLASVGIIANMNPEMLNIIETLKIFNADGSLGVTSAAIAGVGGVTAAALTGMKGLAKPAISASTGTTATVDAPLFATLEVIAAAVLMGLAYLLSKVNPWLLVGLTGIVVLMITGLLIYAIYRLWQLRKGLGKVLYLAQVYPRAGLAVVAEFFVWGSGWLAWKSWGRGVIMLFILALWLIGFFLVQPLIVGFFAFFPLVMPFIGAASVVILLLIYFGIGLYSARNLLNEIEPQIPAVSLDTPEHNFSKV